VAALADGLGQHARVGAAAAARMGPAQPRPARNPDRAHARPLEQLTRAPPAHLRPCAQLAADDARATRTSTSRHASLRTHGTAAAPRGAGLVREDAWHGQGAAAAAARPMAEDDA